MRIAYPAPHLVRDGGAPLHDTEFRSPEPVEQPTRKPEIQMED